MEKRESCPEKQWALLFFLGFHLTFIIIEKKMSSELGGEIHSTNLLLELLRL